MSILRTSFFGAVLSSLCLVSLSTVLHASNIPSIEDYRRRVPAIENFKKEFPQTNIQSVTPQDMKVIEAPRWGEHFSPLGKRMHGIQPDATKVTPSVNNYEVLPFSPKNFGKWEAQDKKYFHRNLDRQTEMKMVKKYSEAPVTNWADLSKGSLLPYDTKDILETATLKDLNRFTPMRNAQRGESRVPKIPVGSGEGSN